jgi:hypothetical protein
MNILSISKWLIPVVAVVGALGSSGIPRNPEPAPTKLEGHRSHLEARIVLSDGTIHTVTLEGVGCPVGLCSRVAVNARAQGDARIEKVWLDCIAAIQDITGRDALFVFTDGTQRRLSVVSENRVLYSTGDGKVDLSHVQSLIFVGAR